ncbi:MAG: tRNA lysidine(34) synthetase TilS, partial [Alphaproteobacteria bacterium]|nr:tRNA lysidine(34) synthetase TilS [Alphaproteobacteria bacterium]
MAVGVSGGADSLALALKAKQELAVFGYKIIALTVNHNLRPSAAEEADYVAHIMARYKIEHHILEWKNNKPESGLEEAARLARYTLMKEWCESHKVQNLMVAHHLLDQAETFLMRLQRGSGLDGLCSIREVSNWNGLNILRPLLHTHPQELKNYLRQQNIQWVEDESNQDTKYLRNKVRKFLPLLEQNIDISAAKIDEAVQNLQSADEYIEEQVENIVSE